MNNTIIEFYKSNSVHDFTGYIIKTPLDSLILAECRDLRSDMKRIIQEIEELHPNIKDAPKADAYGNRWSNVTTEQTGGSNNEKN